MNLADQWFSLPFEFLTVFNHAETEILPGEIQISRAARGDLVFTGVVIERRRKINHAFAALDDAYVISARDLVCLAVD